jgi:serralysin
VADTPTNGPDLLTGTNNAETINGLGGDDDIFGFGGGDFLFGDGNNDEVRGGDGGDLIRGGSGNDRLFGDGGFLPGNDLLFGDSGDDELAGDVGSDRLEGGIGLDRLRGGPGNDFVNGGSGRDVLNGGSGFDRFEFTSTTSSGVGAGNRDLIEDFLDDFDTIDLSGIDARAGVAGNQAFTFIGSGQFTAEGQVRVVELGPGPVQGATGPQLVEVNTSGASGAEMQIEVRAADAQPPLSFEDFLL